MSSDAAQAWLPEWYSQIFRPYVFGPPGLKDYGSAMLRCKIWSFPFLGLRPHTLAQSKERKGSNFAIWQPWARVQRGFWGRSLPSLPASFLQVRMNVSKWTIHCQRRCRPPDARLPLSWVNYTIRSLQLQPSLPPFPPLRHPGLR